MSRWQPIASTVTIAPSIANIPSSAGIATISLNFSDTLTCPSTSRWRAANAETIWIASCAPFFDRRDVLPSMAITSDGIPVSAATHATKQRWNCLASSVASMSPRWSWEGVPSRNGRNRRNSSSFFSPNRAMSVIASDPASTARRHKSNTSSSGYSTLRAVAGPAILEIVQENDGFAECPGFSRSALHHHPPQRESEDHDRFSTSADCHALLHPIAPLSPWVGGDSRREYVESGGRRVSRNDVFAARFVPA